MISSLSNFLNNSIALLSIYDVFIIILFTLVLILCIVSGIIIVSSRVKKINLELSKNKNIQDVQDKIITNRLDLILNKLSNNSVSLSNLTNKDIKNAVINDSNEKLDIYQDSSPEIFKNEKSVLSNERNNINSDNPVNTSKNTYINSSKHNELSSQESEYIDMNQENLSHDIHDIKLDETVEEDNNYNLEPNEEIIDINEKLNNKSKIYINTNSANLETSKNNEIEPYFDKGESIPLDVNNKNKISKINDNDDILFYEDGITLANKILNKLELFSNEEKYEITNFISEDGKYITNFTSNKLSKLTKKELIKQLFIQQLLTIYNYPIKDIEDNYEINLANSIYKKADIIVFNEDNYSDILVLIDTQNKSINLNALIQVAKFSLTPFIVWTNGNNIVYYKNTNGNLKEISDIPQYEESIYSSNMNYNSQFISKPSYNKNYVNNTQQNPRYNNNFSESLNKKNIQNQSQYFSQDVYNIFKKQPYSLSDEYKSIISKYKHLSSPYSNTIKPISQPYANIPLNNFSYTENNINSNLNNNRIPNNSPVYSDYMVNNNLPLYFANSAINMPFNSVLTPTFQHAINNDPNFHTTYNNQSYRNNHSMPFMTPETRSNINVDNSINSFAYEAGFPNYTRFNNYNIIP